MLIARGTQQSDYILAPSEDGRIEALAGDDTVESIGDYYNWKQPTDFFANLVLLGPGDDVAVSGFKGDDTLYGGQGNDTLTTGFWLDWDWGYDSPGTKLFGEAGDDVLTGGGLLNGGVGDDTLIGFGRMIGGSGDDVYKCQIFTNDIIDKKGTSVIQFSDAWKSSYDGDYRDLGGRKIVTGDGKDVISAWGYHVDINSGDRADTIYLSARFGTIRAGNGNDTIEASAERYTGLHGEGVAVFGGTGRDSINGGTFVDGGQGHDVILWADHRAVGGWGSDTVTAAIADGGVGKDVVEGYELGLGGEGDDTVVSHEVGRGGNGDDVITGSGLLLGDNGNDTLEGNNPTDDTLEGGRGFDELRFALHEGDDILRGGGAADTFVLSRFDPKDLPEFIDTLDTIEGFQHGEDLIDVRLRAADFSELAIEQAGDFVVVKDAGGYNLVALADATASDFDAADFIF